MNSINRHTPCHPLERVCQLLILTTLAGAIFAYPLLIDDKLLLKAGSLFPETFLGYDLFKLYDEQVFDAIRMFSMPLVLKEAVATVAILLLIGAWSCWRILRLTQRGDSLKNMITPLHAPLMMLIVWMAVSLFWTPTFNYSLRTFGTAMMGLAFFAIVYDMRKPETLVRRWINFFLAMMLLVALVSFLQHAWPEQIFRIFPRVEGTRNRIGSFIGHNTALASFCLCTCYFLLARLFDRRTSIWLRTLLAIYAILLLFLIVSAQSRGVWVMALIGIPLVVWRASRLGSASQGFKIMGALAVAGALLLTPFQFKDHPLNLTNRRGAQALKRRLVDFSPSIITKGTRFRILTCSLGIVAAKPIRGHGIGSFMYVYPEKQGEYFREHPDTVLQPTKNRTGRAHNDYLQLAIELGLMGLALSLWLIVAAWRSGRRRPRTSTNGEVENDKGERLTYLPIGASCLTILAHGLFDFPIHIICYALLLAWLGAIWASRGKETDAADDQAENAPAEAGERVDPRRMNASAIMLLSLCFIPMLMIVFITPWFIAPVQQGVFMSRGNTFIAELAIKQDMLSLDEKIDRLAYARQMHEQAVEIDPFNGEAVSELARTEGICAELLAQQYRQAVAEQDQPRADYYKTRALFYYAESLDNLDKALKEVRHHSIYAIKGRCFAGRWSIEDKVEDKYSAMLNLEEAINYSYADADAILLLDQMLSMEATGNYREKQNTFRQLLYRYSRDRWDSDFIQKKVARLIEAQDYRRALELLFDLQEAVPQDQDLLTMIINCQVELKELTSARSLIASAMNSGRMTALTENRCQLMIAMAEGDWRTFVRRCRQLLDTPEAFFVDFSHPFEQRENERFLLQLCLLLAREQLGEPGATQELSELQQQREELGPAYAQAFQTSLAMMLLQYFEQPERSMSLFDQLLEDDLLFPGNLTVVIRHWLEHGDRPQAQKYLDHLTARFPRYFLIPQLQAEIKASGQAILISQ